MRNIFNFHSLLPKAIPSNNQTFQTSYSVIVRGVATLSRGKKLLNLSLNSLEKLYIQSLLKVSESLGSPDKSEHMAVLN